MAFTDNLVNLNEDDLLLIAQKSNTGYDNKNITIKQLVEELRLDYAVQEGSLNPPARHGVIMPGQWPMTTPLEYWMSTSTPRV